MTESGESLSNSKKYCSVLEKISKINDVKQNEKHPFIKIFLLQSEYAHITSISSSKRNVPLNLLS